MVMPEWHWSCKPTNLAQFRWLPAVTGCDLVRYKTCLQINSQETGQRLSLIYIYIISYIYSNYITHTNYDDLSQTKMQNTPRVVPSMCHGQVTWSYGYLNLLNSLWTSMTIPLGKLAVGKSHIFSFQSIQSALFLANCYMLEQKPAQLAEFWSYNVPFKHCSAGCFHSFHGVFHGFNWYLTMVSIDFSLHNMHLVNM